MAAQRETSSIPWPTILMILVAAGGTVAYFSPLISSRPDLQIKPGEDIGVQVADARLWQDPFQATFEQSLKRESEFLRFSKFGYSFQIRTEGEPRDITELTRQINSEQGKPYRILGVMVPGAPYAELAEQRHRTRVAVLEGIGIGTRNSVPSDPQHIGFVTVKWPRVPPAIKPETTPSEIRLLMPYEWCERSGIPFAGRSSTTRPATSSTIGAESDAGERILILWLAEEQFADRPLYRLNSLIRSLELPAGSKMQIIGPRVSTTLRSMVEEAASPEGVPECLRKITFFCPTATAEDASLTRGVPDVGKETATEFLEGKGLSVIRTTLDDKVLCTALVKELKLRQISFGRYPSKAADDRSTPSRQEGDHIAIVAEWDTFFGRSLPFSFAAAASGEDVGELIEHPEKWPAEIHPFYYLRGIDGKTPTSEQTIEVRRHDDDGKTSKHDALKSSAPTEQPEGLVQTDYLRRLADQLGRLDADLARSGKRLRAVGVLGTDVYDKLLVLRALRDRLPGVVFFTTGLDARYGLPAEWNAAHNLVIVDSYGLSLQQRYQGGVPPFRDSYQTAVFASLLGAMEPTSHATTTTAPALHSKAATTPSTDPATVVSTRLPSLKTARIFEIGRQGPRDLSPDEGEDVTSLHPGRTDQRWPGPYRWRLTLLFLFLVALLLAAPIVWLRRSFDWKEFREFKWLQHTRVMLPIIAAITCLTILLCVWADPSQGEPFAFIDGISVWPTNAIRIFAALLSIQMIIRACIEMRISDDATKCLFKFRDLSDIANVPDGMSKNDELRLPATAPTLRWSKWYVYGKLGDQQADWICHASEEERPKHGASPKKVFAANLWWEYQRRAGFPNRFVRASVMTLLYGLAGFTLVFLLGKPTPPVRGDFCSDVDGLFTLLSVAGYILLVFFVLDGTYLNFRFINYLSRTDTHWPTGSQQIFWRTGADHYEDLTEYMDIRFIAMRTSVLGRCVYFPFVIYLLLLLSRSTLFDNWDWPVGLVLIFIVNVILTAAGALLLRRAAERARDGAAKKMKHRIMSLQAAGEEKRAKVVDGLRDEVLAEREGAFSVLSQYPTLAAIILPSGGVGIWVLLDYIAKNLG